MGISRGIGGYVNARELVADALVQLAVEEIFRDGDEVTPLGPQLPLPYLEAHTAAIMPTRDIVVFRVQAPSPVLARRAAAAVGQSYIAFLNRRWRPQTDPAQVLDGARIAPGESLSAEIARDGGVAAAFSVMVAASGSLVLVLIRPRRLSTS